MRGFPKRINERVSRGVKEMRFAKIQCFRENIFLGE